MKPIRYLILTLLAIGCSQPNYIQTPVDISMLIERDNVFYLIAEDGTSHEPFTGVATKAYETGQLEFRKRYEKGRQYGAYETYFENGKAKQQGWYKDGQEDGSYTRYHMNGYLAEKGIKRSGKRDGPYEVYYQNGQLAGKGLVKDGKEQGPFAWHYENGEVKVKRIDTGDEKVN